MIRIHACRAAKTPYERMTITHDSRQNAAHIGLREKRAEVETLRISGELNIDLAPDGAVYGNDLLNANEQLALGSDGKLVLVDEARGGPARYDFADGIRP